MNSEARTLEDFAKTALRVVAVCESSSKFFHYAAYDKFLAQEDKRDASTLCERSALDTWAFASRGRLCQTCLSKAGRAVVVTAPLLTLKRPSGHVRVIAAPQAGRCEFCRLPYEARESVWTKKDVAVLRHEACGPHVVQEPPPAPRLLTSLYDGRCRVCTKPYASGERIWWKRGEGVHHEACGPHGVDGQRSVA